MRISSSAVLLIQGRNFRGQHAGDLVPLGRSDLPHGENRRALVNPLEAGFRLRDRLDRDYPPARPPARAGGQALGAKLLEGFLDFIKVTAADPREAPRLRLRLEVPPDDRMIGLDRRGRNSLEATIRLGFEHIKTVIPPAGLEKGLQRFVHFLTVFPEYGVVERPPVHTPERKSTAAQLTNVFIERVDVRDLRLVR